MVDVNELMQYERQLQEQGYKYICGVDEVGRGPLAGPVVCAAVVMPLDLDSLVVGVDDSKKVSIKKRETLSEEIKKRVESLDELRAAKQAQKDKTGANRTNKLYMSVKKRMKKLPMNCARK